MFTDAVFIIARTWKQPRCPLTDEWIKKLCYIDNGLLLSHKKQRIWDSPNKVDEPTAYYKSEREKQLSHTNTYIWNLERQYWRTYWQVAMETQKLRRDLWTQFSGGKKARVGGMETVTWKHTLSYVKQTANRNLLYDSGNANWGSRRTQRKQGGR